MTDNLQRAIHKVRWFGSGGGWAVPYDPHLTIAEADALANELPQETSRFGTLGRRTLEELYQAALERISLLEKGHQRCFTDSDYCYCCDCHPSSGHAKDCPFA